MQKMREPKNGTELGLTLFDIAPIEMPKIKLPDAHCRTCLHRQPTACGGSIIQYCNKVTSNRTFNGKLKIKCKTPACQFYEKAK